MSKNSHQEMTAIIYDKKGHVLAIGKNSYVKTHTMMAKFAKKVNEPEKVYLHAEIDAIIRCHDISKAHKIFVSRPLKSGKYGLATPCKICMAALKETNITVIEHT